MCATQITGGWVDEVNFHTSSGWLATFSAFLVSNHLRMLTFTISEALALSPGSAVAVERIFSAGRDTISLRCASLHADTIRVLMLVKKRLHLARAKANAALGR